MMIEKDRKIYLQLVNSLVGLENSNAEPPLYKQQPALEMMSLTAFSTLYWSNWEAKSFTPTISCSIVRGFVVLRWCIACPQNQKSSGERSWLHGGQTWVILLEMTRPSNLVSNQFLTISMATRWCGGTILLPPKILICNFASNLGPNKWGLQENSLVASRFFCLFLSSLSSRLFCC